MCYQAIITCLGRLRSTIVSYAELAGTMEAGAEREQILDYAQDLARQAKVVEELCNRRCGSSRCSAGGGAGA